jgi:hypothetical protein
LAALGNKNQKEEKGLGFKVRRRRDMANRNEKIKSDNPNTHRGKQTSTLRRITMR